MEFFLCLILLCGILLYAYDLFILRKKKIDIKKNKKKEKNIIINNDDANSLEEVLTILDK